MKFTQKQIEAYVEFFTILANIERRVELDKQFREDIPPIDENDDSSC